MSISESVERFPSVKSFAVFALVAWILTAILMGAVGIYAVPIDPTLDKWADKWLDTLLWLTGAVVFGIVGKHVAAKPEIVRANADAEAKKVLAKAEAEAVITSATHPAPPPSNLIRETALAPLPAYVPPMAHTPNAQRAAIEATQPATATAAAAHQYDEGA
jgi:hypothetical protein